MNLLGVTENHDPMVPPPVHVETMPAVRRALVMKVPSRCVLSSIENGDD